MRILKWFAGRLFDFQIQNSQLGTTAHSQSPTTAMGTGFITVAYFHHRIAIQAGGLTGWLFNGQHGILSQCAMSCCGETKTQRVNFDAG